MVKTGRKNPNDAYSDDLSKPAHDREAATENKADLRKEPADRRQPNIDLAQQAAHLREEVAALNEASARAKAEHDSSAAELLQKANECLVVATVHAQTLAESAERSAVTMAHLAEHDFLTGLPSRSVLTDRLAQSIALAQRHGKKVALMYLDLDHFKHINDTLGHAVGDQMLQSAAKRLQACVRLSDTVCRQGGDEFVVLLGEVETMHDAVLAAGKLIDAMTQPHVVSGHRLHVTLSIGISLYPDHGNDAETMLRNADTAMYHAKKSGRNNYQVFTPDMNTRSVVQQTIDETLSRALKQQEFVLHYQPKVNLETGTLIGAEALIRLQQAGHSLVYPTEFVSVAEDCGLILPLGRWVLREACRQTKAWLAAGLDIGQVAVNVSASEFHSKGFFVGVQNILKDIDLEPRRLELELTESGLMQDIDPTMVNLSALKEIGVSIAIDDFGTGYSSLSYLRRLPIDTLKIDQSFVSDIAADEGIISAIIAMGKNLDLRVVAEGIETRQQLAFLRTRACAEGQGYYFSRPVPADEFAAILAAGQHH